MKRQDFIQHASIHFLPFTEWDVPRAIAYAERLWQRLEEQGHTPKATAPRPHTDHLSTLEPAQAARFAAFWRAFDLPKGKQRAALAWAKIRPDEALAARITQAARAEATKPRASGEVRKWAEGWLNERRWEDVEPAPGADPPPDPKARELRELRQELAALIQLRQRSGNPELDATIHALEAKVKQCQQSTPASAPPAP